MGEATAIKWTDHTFNPWQGCTKVSPACDHCYAETLSKRVGHPERWGPDGARDVTSDAYWRNPIKWDRAAAERGRPALVFCASMADVFEDRPDLDEIHDARQRLLEELIVETPNLIWLLLTKRPQNVLEMVPQHWLVEGTEEWETGEWPTNVWVGTTVEDQERADERIDHLARIPAPVRFLSCEPLLGSIDLLNHITAIDWIIAGGESGPGYRPLDVGHARSLRQQADLWDVPFFFKQHGGNTAKAGGHLLDGEVRQAWPAAAGDRSTPAPEADR